MSTANTSETVDVRANIIAVGQRLIGAKGFSAVGLNEILSGAGVPKGSFYHYFGSKDAFGVAMLESYFEEYLAEMDAILAAPDLTMAQRLMNYWGVWQETQSFSECQGKCLAVKLGAEVADMSEAMRAVLDRGTAGIVARLADAIEAGVAYGSLAIHGNPRGVAQSLYQLWLGASVMVKIVRNTEPFATALATTRHMLNPSD
ncbi:TetR/AcrR family transcriptional repressor of nem operon [Paraburkholderia sp. GAS199]|uniref:TetR/AcrR family transcriptional regulator n=1 Tax=Paraburkholderia sp. GAS199 TaxID=3035126 RepID=UPI003D23F399